MARTRTLVARALAIGLFFLAVPLVPALATPPIPKLTPDAVRSALPQPNELSGTLTYDFPIVVPPGRNGMQPDLKLAYNSQPNSITTALRVSHRSARPIARSRHALRGYADWLIGPQTTLFPGA